MNRSDIFGNVVALLSCLLAFFFTVALFNIGWATIGLVTSVGSAMMLRFMNPVDVESADILWIVVGSMMLWILIIAILGV